MGFVEYEVRDRIAYLTLNRPQKLNALTNEGIQEIVAALQRFDQDDDAFVAILSGRGSAFSSGADVRERLTLATQAGGNGPRFTNEASAFFASRNWKPVIAAVHGYALGHALMTAFYCDVVIAAAGTQFQVTEPRWGVPAAGQCALLSGGRLDPFVNEVVLTSRFWTAEEALARGLIHSIAPHGEHVAAAEAVARQILENSAPLAVRATVAVRRRRMEKLITEVGLMTPDTRWEASADFAESMRAFTEKRKPVFKGR